MTRPTVGRVVLFTPAKDDTNPVFALYKPPFAALVSYVLSDASVNLMVIDPEGKPVSRTCVRLIRDGDEKPADGRYCEIAKTETMPKGVAA